MRREQIPGGNESSPSLGRRRSTLVAVVAIAVPWLLVCVGVEAALRAAGFRPMSADPEMYVWQGRDDIWPYALRPGWSGTFAGGLVTIDRHGNRTVAHAPEGDQADAKLRQFIVLGDSVAFGMGVDDKDTIASNLQRIAGYGTRIISIAAPGYSSWNELAALTSHGHWSRDAAVVLIYVENDITKDNDAYKFGERRPTEEPDALRALVRLMDRHSRLLYLINESLRRLRASILSPQLHRGVVVDESALDYSMEAVSRMRDHCRENGASFTVALYRTVAFYEAPADVMAYERAVGARLAKLGVPHFVLERVTTELPRSRATPHWADGGHPSASASRIIAEEIAARLLRERS